jgi:hypothetical protein
MAGKPQYGSAEELQWVIDTYFDGVGKKSISGLALHLGFESRQSFYDYEKNEIFSYTIKKARLRLEQQYEESLMSQYVVGSIFALKNLGWKDKSEMGFTDKDGNDRPVINFIPDKDCDPLKDE